ncbi:hypothetical protein FPV16_25850, partial [Methylobacterium sp. W2]|uniref:calcium-binding protein n=1 Tax=Methylobacterium sp. W2 TaxID=2598107 RepID=UPI0029CAC0A6
MYSPPSIYNSQPEISIKIDKDIEADYLLIEGSDDSNAILYWSYGDGTLLDATRYAGGYLFNFSDRLGTTEIHGGNYSDVMIGGANTDLLYGGSGNDILRGGAGNDVLEGGAGADTLNGGSGIDTASYERASAGVSVDLLFGLNGGGDAAGDVFDSIENINGSAFDDNLRGDDGANTLRGKGGADNLYGEGGNDRLVVSDGVLDVVGGGGTDSVFVVGGGTLYADPARFVGIEKVYVREGTNLDMSDMYGGMQISSNSKIGAGVTIIGTHDADRI